jgi:hypothetical protein
MDTLLEILKWVILILLAGFIGQFGRAMSHHVMNYFRKKREKRASIESETTNGIKREIMLPSKEKKLLKAQLKAKKNLEKSKRKG